MMRVMQVNLRGRTPDGPNLECVGVFGAGSARHWNSLPCQLGPRTAVFSGIKLQIDANFVHDT